MPFTLTHLAAVVPVKKLTGTWLPFTALALGSMVPDMPMFFGFFMAYPKTHSLNGIFTACLPIGLGMYILFQLLVRTPLLELMPNAISVRLGERRRHDLKYVAGIVVALIIGAATHVLWDSFTHASGWGARQFPDLLYKQFVLFNRSHRYYTLLQHGSSVVFLPLLAWGLYRWSRTPFEPLARPYQSRLELPLWIKLAGCFTLFVAPAMWAVTEAWLDTHSFYYGIGPAARAYGRYMLLTIISVSVIMQIGLWLLHTRKVRRA